MGRGLQLAIKRDKTYLSDIPLLTLVILNGILPT